MVNPSKYVKLSKVLGDRSRVRIRDLQDEFNNTYAYTMGISQIKGVLMSMGWRKEDEGVYTRSEGR